MLDFLFSKKFKKKIKRIEEIEPQEIFLDNLAKKREAEIGLSEKKFEVLLSKNVFLRFLIIFFILIFFLFLKTFQLQIIEGKKYSQLSKENRQRTYLILPKRGVIYDKNGKQLVFNQPSFDLILDKRDLKKGKKEREEILKKISQIIKKDFSQLKKEIEESDFSRILISENLDHQTLILLESKINSKEISGFQIEKNTIRDYLDGPIFSHLIGYTSKISKEEFKNLKNYSISDYIGKVGLEKSYEKVLRGEPGILEIERDAFGKKRSEKIISEPKEGKNLILHLDSELQKKIKESLLKNLKKRGGEKGVAVALDPKTGGVLALISFPDFDNNLFSKGIFKEKIEKILKDPLRPLFNRAISGEYSVGSTIKPLIALAALKEKIILPKEKINCQGVIFLEDPWHPKKFYKFQDWKVHGLTDLKKAIAESCNVYFYRLGGGDKDFEGLGVNNIKKYLKLFGWGEISGIDLPGEEKGRIPDPQWKKNYFKNPEEKIWRKGDTYHLSIGHGYLLVTPLQVALAFSAIANGGKLLKPQVVKKIVDEKENLIKEFKPETIREDFIDQKDLQIVKEGMREAVIYGTAKILKNLPEKVACKTGTVESGKKGYYHHWIAVFAPYENPEIVLVILAEEIKGWQSAVLPVAKEVLKWYFEKERLAKIKGKVKIK
jgi:penicillin-binding protein 2